MKNKLKSKKIKLTFKRAEGVSEEEAQRRLDHAFGVLFDEMLKRGEINFKK